MSTYNDLKGNRDLVGFISPCTVLRGIIGALVELNCHLCMVHVNLPRASPYFSSKLEIWRLQDYTYGVWSLDTRINLSGHVGRDLLHFSMLSVKRVIGAIGNGGSGQKIIIASSGHKVH